MGVLLRSRPLSSSAAKQAPATGIPVPVPALAGAELGDDELEQVVGGLERVYVPGLAIAG